MPCPGPGTAHLAVAAPVRRCGSGARRWRGQLPQGSQCTGPGHRSANVRPGRVLASAPGVVFDTMAPMTAVSSTEPAAQSDLPPAQRRISRRIAAITESATLAVDARAKALKAAGKPVIGFGAGEPDFPTPEYIVEAAVAACRQPAMHRYTPAGGVPALKEAVVAETARDSGYEVAADQVLVTNGGKQAVYQAFATLLDPGDEVLLPAPYWTTYPEAVRLAGGVPVEVFAGENQDYLVTV